MGDPELAKDPVHGSIRSVAHFVCAWRADADEMKHALRRILPSRAIGLLRRVTHISFFSCHVDSDEFAEIFLFESLTKVLVINAFAVLCNKSWIVKGIPSIKAYQECLRSQSMVKLIIVRPAESWINVRLNMGFEKFEKIRRRSELDRLSAVFRLVELPKSG